MPKRKLRFSITPSAPVILAATLILGALLYAGAVTLPFFRGPSLSIKPIERRDSDVVSISGFVARVSALEINGMSIPVTEDGRFSIERAFPKGYTVLTIRASDRFGRTKEERIALVTGL